MKSRIKSTSYIAPVFLVGFFLFVLVGVSIDKTLGLFSTPWFILLFLFLIFSFWFIAIFRKIPKLEFKNDFIRYKTNGINDTFMLTEIINIERIKSNRFDWYSRGGLEIFTKKSSYRLPFHIYSNESKLLNLLYRTDKHMVELSRSYRLANLSPLKFFYRNIYTIFLVLSIPFFYINEVKSGPIWSKLIIYFLACLLISLFTLTANYVKLEGRHLIYYTPLLLRKTKIALKDIDLASSTPIRTGRGSKRNLMIELTNKKNITYYTELNTQNELDAIRIQINNEEQL